MADVALKRGDLLPVLHATLTDKDGNPVPLDTATAVKMTMGPENGGALVIDGAAMTVLDASAAEVAYEWQAGDTDTVGDFLVEFEAVFPGGSMHFPSEGFKTVKIEERLAASAPGSAPVLTVPELARAMKIECFTQSDEEEAAAVIAEVQSALEQYLSRPVTVREFTEAVPVGRATTRDWHDGISPGYPNLHLPWTPVVEITEILVDGVPVDLSQQWLRRWGIEGYFAGVSVDGTVLVTWTAGLDTTKPENAVLRGILKRAAAREMVRRKDDVQGVKQLQDEGYRAEFLDPEDYFTPRELKRVARFKRRRMAMAR